jgi:ferredoxin-NADP reductase
MIFLHLQGITFDKLEIRQLRNIVMEHTVKILAIEKVTHDVNSYTVEKPEGYVYKPGQATDLSVNKEGWTDKKKPFTFTSLVDDPHLQFVIKHYPAHEGVTNQLRQLKVNDELIIRDIWGAIAYKSEGYFIAGGAGLTPFIAIFRQLHKDGKIGKNELFFSNKTESDIILHAELEEMLGKQAHYIITDPPFQDHKPEKIDKEYLTEHIKDFTKPFYVCGPHEMTGEITKILAELGATPESLVFEKSLFEKDK